MYACFVFIATTNKQNKQKKESGVGLQLGAILLKPHFV